MDAFRMPRCTYCSICLSLSFKQIDPNCLRWKYTKCKNTQFLLVN